MKRPSQNTPKPTYEQLKKENIQLKKTVEKLQEVETRLNEKEAHLRTLIKSLPFDVFAIDKNGRYSMHLPNSVSKSSPSTVPRIRNF